MRSWSLLLATILICATTTESTCPWTTVDPDPVVPPIEYDPTIQNIGRWAVEQHYGLSFVKVVGGRQQAIGNNCANTLRCYYELMIDASNRAGATPDRYKAVVYVYGWTHPKQLISFDREVRTSVS